MENTMADPFGRDTCNSESCVSMAELCEIKFGNLDPMLNYVISTTPTGAVELLPTEESSFGVTNNGNGTGTISTAGGNVDFITAPVDYCEKFNECFTAPVTGPLNAATDWQTAANITSECLADVKDRLVALEDIDPVVSIVQNAAGDYVATTASGATSLVDIPTLSVTNNADGTINLLVDGVVAQSGISTGVHTVDTDTTYTFTTAADGSVSIFTSGILLAQTAPNVIDTDTFSVPAANPDGTVTVTYANGISHTYATGQHTVDTHGTVTGNTISFPDSTSICVATCGELEDVNDRLDVIEGIDPVVSIVPNTDGDYVATTASGANSLIDIKDRDVIDDAVIPVSAFADPECPTQAEAQAWAIATYPNKSGSIEYASPSGRTWVLNFNSITGTSNWNAAKQRIRLLDAFVADGTVDYPNQTYVTVAHTTGINPTYGAYNAGVYTFPFDGWYIIEAEVYNDYRHGPTDANLTSSVAFIDMTGTPAKFLGQMRDTTDNGFTAHQMSGQLYAYARKGQTVQVKALQINRAAEVHNRVGFAFTQERFRVTFAGEE